MKHTKSSLLFSALLCLTLLVPTVTFAALKIPEICVNNERQDVKCPPAGTDSFLGLASFGFSRAMLFVVIGSMATGLASKLGGGVFGLDFSGIGNMAKGAKDKASKWGTESRAGKNLKSWHDDQALKSQASSLTTGKTVATKIANFTSPIFTRKDRADVLKQDEALKETDGRIEERKNALDLNNAAVKEKESNEVAAQNTLMEKYDPTVLATVSATRKQKRNDRMLELRAQQLDNGSLTDQEAAELNYLRLLSGETLSEADHASFAGDSHDAMRTASDETYRDIGGKDVFSALEQTNPAQREATLSAMGFTPDEQRSLLDVHTNSPEATNYRSSKTALSSAQRTRDLSSNGLAYFIRERDKIATRKETSQNKIDAHSSSLIAAGNKYDSYARIVVAPRVSAKRLNDKMESISKSISQANNLPEFIKMMTELAQDPETQALLLDPRAPKVMGAWMRRHSKSGKRVNANSNFTGASKEDWDATNTEIGDLLSDSGSPIDIVSLTNPIRAAFDMKASELGPNHTAEGSTAQRMAKISADRTAIVNAREGRTTGANMLKPKRAEDFSTLEQCRFDAATAGALEAMKTSNFVEFRDRNVSGKDVGFAFDDATGRNIATEDTRATHYAQGKYNWADMAINLSFQQQARDAVNAKHEPAISDMIKVLQIQGLATKGQAAKAKAKLDEARATKDERVKTTKIQEASKILLENANFKSLYSRTFEQAHVGSTDGMPSFTLQEACYVNKGKPGQPEQEAWSGYKNTMNSITHTYGGEVSQHEDHVRSGLNRKLGLPDDDGNEAHDSTTDHGATAHPVAAAMPNPHPSPLLSTIVVGAPGHEKLMSATYADGTTAHQMDLSGEEAKQVLTQSGIQVDAATPEADVIAQAQKVLRVNGINRLLLSKVENRSGATIKPDEMTTFQNAMNSLFVGPSTPEDQATLAGLIGKLDAARPENASLIAALNALQGGQNQTFLKEAGKSGLDLAAGRALTARDNEYYEASKVPAAVHSPVVATPVSTGGGGQARDDLTADDLADRLKPHFLGIKEAVEDLPEKMQLAKMAENMAKAAGLAAGQSNNPALGGLDLGQRNDAQQRIVKGLTDMPYSLSMLASKGLLQPKTARGVASAFQALGQGPTKYKADLLNGEHGVAFAQAALATGDKGTQMAMLQDTLSNPDVNPSVKSQVASEYVKAGTTAGVDPGFQKELFDTLLGHKDLTPESKQEALSTYITAATTAGISPETQTQLIATTLGNTSVSDQSKQESVLSLATAATADSATPAFRQQTFEAVLSNPSVLAELKNKFVEFANNVGGPEVITKEIGQLLMSYAGNDVPTQEAIALAAHGPNDDDLNQLFLNHFNKPTTDPDQKAAMLGEPMIFPRIAEAVYETAAPSTQNAIFAQAATTLPVAHNTRDALIEKAIRQPDNITMDDSNVGALTEYATRVPIEPAIFTPLFHKLAAAVTTDPTRSAQVANLFYAQSPNVQKDLITSDTGELRRVMRDSSDITHASRYLSTALDPSTSIPATQQKEFIAYYCSDPARVPIGISPAAANSVQNHMTAIDPASGAYQVTPNQLVLASQGPAGANPVMETAARILNDRRNTSGSIQLGSLPPAAFEALSSRVQIIVPPSAPGGSATPMSPEAWRGYAGLATGNNFSTPKDKQVRENIVIGHLTQEINGMSNIADRLNLIHDMLTSIHFPELKVILGIPPGANLTRLGLPQTLETAAQANPAITPLRNLLAPTPPTP